MDINFTLKIVPVLKKHGFVFLVTLIFLLTNSFGFAQVSTYTYNESLSGYTALTAPLTAYAAPWDDHVNGAAFAAPIGFPFNYDGLSHTQCFISPNGYVTFGTQPASNGYLPLSVAAPFNGGGAISALGMDLISGIATDDIVYNTIGTAPNRIFVAQWTNARRKVELGNFNFQIRLYETSNVVEISYGACTPASASAYSTQVGLRGITNDFLQGSVNNRLQNGVNTNFQWSGRTVTGTVNSSTVRTSSSEFPNTGLVYTYTPSLPCTIPTASATAFSVGALSVDATSSNGNSFTAALPAPTNYLIVRSTVNSTPNNIDIPNGVYWAVNDLIAGTYSVISTSNATSFSQTGLTPNTRYYYWAIPYNANCLGGPFYKMSSIAAATVATCIESPTALIAANVDGNSFLASWDAVAGATDYQIDVSTSSTFTTTLPLYTNVSTGGMISISVTGLVPLTTYYYRVRASSLGCGLNSATVTVATLCGAFPIPYFQNFDTTPVATVPSCFTVADDNLDGITWQVQNTAAASTPNAYHLRTNTPTSADDWFFLPGLNLTGGVTYRLKFKYNTTVTGSFAENLRVRMGSSPTASNMNVTLSNLSNITNTVYQTAVVDFTPIVTDAYYLGFQGSSFVLQSKILIDDISIIVSPTCFEPTNIVVTTVGVTTATIAWTASTPPPANGYQYYLSTSNVQPSAAVLPAGSVGAGITTATLTGLAAATLYYVWVRGNCSASDKSEWSLIQTFSTDCAAPALLPRVNGSLCGGGSATLQVTPASGSTVQWYSDLAATNVVGSGNNFVTPTLFATTTYYAQSTATGGLVNVGALSPVTQGGSLAVQTNPTYINFTVGSTTTFQSINIYPMVSGQSGTLTIRNAANTVLALYSYVTNVAGGTAPQTLLLNYNLSPGNYSIYFDVMPAAGLIVNSNNATYPYASSIATITGNDFDTNYYMYAYNWRFSNLCRSLLTPVTANISPAPPISFSSTTATICTGETTPVVTVAGFAAYTNFVWSPSAGVAGSLATGFTFSPTLTTTYSLTASQTSGSLCASLISFTVLVNLEPPAISVVPATATLCIGAVQPLNASLASAVATTIFSENFNGPTNNWTTINNSVGGIPTNSSWTLRNSPYPAPAPVWANSFISNDNSQFYFSDSYSQEGPSTNSTRTYLISPSINLAGYTSATFSFWQFLRYIGGNRARVEASTDGGTTWFTMLTQIASQGASNGFVNRTVDLAPLLGNPNVRLRFYYDASYDYGWAIDNVSITATIALEVSWAPATELFFDIAATTPYIAGTPTATVYAKPTVSRTYTGTALGSNGCSTSDTAVITVVPAILPGTLSSNQTICSGFAPNSLLLSGATGTIVRWEYATNAAFTTGLTPIINTTATLTSAAIGTFSGDRYYRVVSQSGSCPVVYSTSVFIRFNATTWNGSSWTNGTPDATTRAIFAGNYSSTADLQACAVEVLSGVVTFNTNHTLTVQNDVKVSGGSLIFEDKSSLVQINFLDNNAVPFSNIGSITYKRTTTPMFKFDYTYWSSPVSPQNLQSISPTAPSGLFFLFNSSSNNWQSVNPATTNMVAGKGYICRAPIAFPTSGPATPQAHTANFSGVPNNGLITIPVVGGASQFNLFGNPYPSALSADAFLLDAANAATLSGTIYLWTHNTPINTSFQYTGSDYAIYNYLGGVVGGVPTGPATNVGLNNSVPNGKIASGQGFFIKGLSNGTATFKNTMRIGGNNDQFFRIAAPAVASSTTSETEKHRYWLNIANTQGAFKQALIGYAQTATLGLDRLFDGEMVDVGNAITLYTVVDAIKLSIQGRPVPFDVSDTIPLGYKSTITSAYTISLFDFDGLFTNQTIYLEDRTLNIIHDLKAANYTFTTNSGTFDDRFLLRYTSGTLATTTPVFNDNAVVIYKNADASFVINSGTFIMNEVKVFDIRGRLLLVQKDINAAQTQFNEGITNQVLLVQITTADGITVTKKVIR